MFHHYLPLNVQEKDIEKNTVPSWVGSLLQRKFFHQCQQHNGLKNSELRMYCIECNASLCSHCLLSSSVAHRYLQIRRYVYNDVIRVEDMKKFVDCSKVQAFTVNGNRVVFLNPKGQAEKPQKRNKGAYPCMTCERTLPEPDHYCSIACKIGENQKLPSRASSSSSQPLECENSSAAAMRGAQRRKGVPRRSPLV